MPDTTIHIDFPGGKKVNAHTGEFVIQTDQSIKAGGEGSAPEPFDLFLASISTCAGIFALGFCQSRKLPTDGIDLKMVCERDPKKKMFTRMSLQLTLPEGFPEKYRPGIIRAMDLCAVKKHIADAPEFSVELIAPEIREYAD
ncbi:MAG: osmotically inducible protein OsmC [Gammaproteobacteria bacterium]|nr:osmotically inducible protein OsmC [Gammaproteobacteria bacterium]